MGLKHKIVSQIVRKYGFEVTIIWWKNGATDKTERVIINFPHGVTPSQNSIDAKIKTRLKGIKKKLEEIPVIPDYDAMEMKEALIAKGKMTRHQTLRDYVDKLGVVYE